MFLQFDDAAPAPKYEPPTRGPTAVAVGISLYFVAVVFVSAQILVKAKLGKLGAEDILIFLAAIVLLSMLICTCILCKYGFGMHLADIKPEWMLTFGKFTYTLCILATGCLAFTKLALLSFYLRFATSPRFRTTCLVAMSYTALTQAAILLLNTLGCWPISGAWDRRPGNPSVCVTTTEFYVFASASNIGTDVVLLLLPIPIVMRLRLAWGVKLGLIGMFSMGFIVTAISGITMWKMLIAIGGRGDPTWDGAYSWMCTLLELDLGIVTTCMPGMKLFITWVRAKRTPATRARAPADEGTIGGGGARRQIRGGGWECELGSEVTEEGKEGEGDGMGGV